MNIIDYYKDNNKPIKLNIGCRNKPLPTYINIDIDPNNQLADLIDNGFELKSIIDESCDLIEVVHMAEHLTYTEFKKALDIWWNKLKDGGILRLSVPDSIKCAGLLGLTGDRDIVKCMFLGSQLNAWDMHKTMHTKDSLIADLINSGFKDIREWEWNKSFPHNYCDTYASAYFPAMRKQFILDNGKEVDLGGVCISLNIEATK
jgi:hypothetical protein